jgi:hypothetical protein
VISRYYVEIATQNSTEDKGENNMNCDFCTDLRNQICLLQQRNDARSNRTLRVKQTLLRDHLKFQHFTDMETVVRWRDLSVWRLVKEAAK